MTAPETLIDPRCVKCGEITDRRSPNGRAVCADCAALALRSRTSWTAAQLQSTDFPEPRWAIPGVVAEGTTVLAGRPKLGKSWLALGWAVSVATGGKAMDTREVEEGGALVLALEDSPRRLRTRLDKLFAPGDPWPDRLRFETSWPKLDAAGCEQLSAHLDADPSIRLVVIDTLEKARPPRKGKDAYAEDYAALGTIQTLSQAHGVAVVIVHHDRKGGADDFLDAVLGTSGITGAVDTVAVLARERGRLDAVLNVTGRDLDEELEIALEFDRQSGWWRELGPAEVWRLDRERAEVVALFDLVNEVTASIVCEELDISPEAARQRLSRMARDGTLASPKRGVYTLSTPVTTVTTFTRT